MIKTLDISNEREVEQVMTIWSESTIKAHDFIKEDYWLAQYNIVKDKYLPHATTYTYIDGGEIKGFISIMNKNFIGALFVDVKEQGKGIGRALINHVKETYKKGLSLAVYKDNKQAVEFYKRVGFRIQCEQLNQDTNEREYLMVL